MIKNATLNLRLDIQPEHEQMDLCVLHASRSSAELEKTEFLDPTLEKSIKIEQESDRGWMLRFRTFANHHDAASAQQRHSQVPARVE